MKPVIGKVWQNSHFSADVYLFDIVVGPLTLTFALENFYAPKKWETKIIPPSYIQQGSYTKLRTDSTFMSDCADLIHERREKMLQEAEHAKLHEFQKSKGVSAQGLRE